MDLEVFTDASIKTINGRTFGSAGAYIPSLNQSMIKICSDSTNNKSELWAIYTGVILSEMIYYKGGYDRVILYSDSQFGIFGLTRWMDSWIINEYNGVLYNSSRQAVKNQELFKMIITYCYMHRYGIHFRHQKGHVSRSLKDLSNARRVFQSSNGYDIGLDRIEYISQCNDYIDKLTRESLEYINPNQYPILTNSGEEICKYINIPKDYKKYIR